MQAPRGLDAGHVGIADLDALRAWATQAGFAVESLDRALLVGSDSGLGQYLPAVTENAPARSRVLLLEPEPSVAAAEDRARAAALAMNFFAWDGQGPRVWDMLMLRFGATFVPALVLDGEHTNLPDVVRLHSEVLALQDGIQQRFPRIVSTAGRQASGTVAVFESGQRELASGWLSVDGVAWVAHVAEANVERLHFGDRNPFTRRPYLYQQLGVVPGLGKRDTGVRWDRMCAMLGDAGVELRDRVVLDLGCNSGLFIAESLGAGARWGLGWDIPEVAEAAESMLLALGYTRFTITAGHLDAASDTFGSIPAHLQVHLNDAVIFYLSVRKHIGMLEVLPESPWAAMVYEGHEGETLADARRHLTPILGSGASIMHESIAADGPDGTRRPLVLLQR